jgi:hypothetical protein
MQFENGNSKVLRITLEVLSLELLWTFWFLFENRASNEMSVQFDVCASVRLHIFSKFLKKTLLNWLVLTF